jgi:hypothetical protein
MRTIVPAGKARGFSAVVVAGAATGVGVITAGAAAVGLGCGIEGEGFCAQVKLASRIAAQDITAIFFIHPPYRISGQRKNCN